MRGKKGTLGLRPTSVTRRQHPPVQEMRFLRVLRGALAALVALHLAGRVARAQQALETRAPTASLALEQPQGGREGAPLTITLQDALKRAEANSPQFQNARTAVKIAGEGRAQARAARLPSVSYMTQYLNTQGNGLPTGRFVTNDGVHVYRLWGVFHEEMPGSFFISAGPRAAAYQEALAREQAEIARRGLAVTVTNAYYALVVAERNYAQAQQSLEQAKHFLRISQDLERGGEVAHTDVIRFELQFNQQQQTMQESQLAMANAHLDLSVLMFPNLNENFAVVDDLDMAPPLLPFADAENLARNNNPEVRAALTSFKQADLNVAVAKTAFYPSLSIDFVYGIESNSVAFFSRPSSFPERVPELGYFGTYTFNLPLFDWGMRRSKLKQSEYERRQAYFDLTFAQRQTLRQFYAYYNESETAWKELDSLRQSADLAAQNLRLMTMRYKAGEAPFLDLVDAQNSLNQARGAYNAGQARYRVALSRLQTITGPF
jgi:outer membrane protein TolC